MIAHSQHFLIDSSMTDLTPLIGNRHFATLFNRSLFTRMCQADHVWLVKLSAHFGGYTNKLILSNPPQYGVSDHF